MSARSRRASISRSLETFTFPLADGFTFTIQGNNPSALGVGGGDLGYGGIGNSVAIKFDYYDNAGEGDDSTGIFTDGQDPYVPAIDLTGTGVNISSGDVMNVTMNYNGSTLNVTITDTATLGFGLAVLQREHPERGRQLDGIRRLHRRHGRADLDTGDPQLDVHARPAPRSAPPTSNRSTTSSRPLRAGITPRCPGSPGPDYSLVATRGSDFTLHGNSFDNAQPSTASTSSWAPSSRPAGACNPSTTQLYSDFNPIYRDRPRHRRFGSPSIATPGSPASYPFGQNMAYDGTFTYYNDGYGGNGHDLQARPHDRRGGRLVHAAATVTLYTGLAYLNGDLYADATSIRHQHLHLRRATLGLLSRPSTGITDSAWSAWPATRTWASSSPWARPVRPATSTRSTPRPAACSSKAPTTTKGLYEQDLAYANGLLIVSDTNGVSGPGNNFLDEYDPNTLGFVQRVVRPTPAKPRAWPATAWAAQLATGTSSTSTPATTWSSRRPRPAARAPTACNSSMISTRRSTSTTPAATWSPPRPATQPTAATTSSTGRR